MIGAMLKVKDNGKQYVGKLISKGTSIFNWKCIDKSRNTTLTSYQ